MKKHNSCPQNQIKSLKSSFNCPSFTNKESTLVQRYQHSIVIQYNNRIRSFSNVEINNDCSFIDLSLNNLSNFSNFPQTLIHLTTLILDTNQIESFQGIQLSNSFPKLRFLSLRKNPIAGYSNFKVMCLIVFGSQLHTINGEKVNDIQRQTANKLRKTAFTELTQGKIIKNLQPLKISDISPQKNLHSDGIPNTLHSSSFTPRTNNFKAVKLTKTKPDQKRIKKVVNKNKMRKKVSQNEKRKMEINEEEELHELNNKNNQEFEEEQKTIKSENYQELKVMKNIENEKESQSKSDIDLHKMEELKVMKNIESEKKEELKSDIDLHKMEELKVMNNAENEKESQSKSDIDLHKMEELKVMKNIESEKKELLKSDIDLNNKEELNALINDICKNELNMMKSDTDNFDNKSEHEGENEVSEKVECNPENKKLSEDQEQKMNEIKLIVNIIDEPSVNKEVQMSLEYPEACQFLILDDETY